MSGSIRFGSREVHQASAINPSKRARYTSAAHAENMYENIKCLIALTNDYDALVTAGDMPLAVGACLELIDLGLKIAATPCINDTERSYKASLCSKIFPIILQVIDHGHVASIADAAIAIERAL